MQLKTISFGKILFLPDNKTKSQTQLKTIHSEKKIPGGNKQVKPLGFDPPGGAGLQ